MEYGKNDQYGDRSKFKRWKIGGTVLSICPIKKSPPLKLESFGLSILEMMLAMGLTSGFLLMDLKRQKNSQIATNRTLASETAGTQRSIIKKWLRHRETIEKSFGVTDPTSTDRTQRAQLVGYNNGVTCATTNRDSNAVVGNPDPRNPIVADPCAIKRIVLSLPGTTPGQNPDNKPCAPNSNNCRNTPSLLDTSVLISGTPSGSNVTLIGPPQGGSIRSLDENGQVYIRTMWVEDFEPYHSFSMEVVDTPNPPRNIEFERGSAEMKISVWKFTNLIDRPGLDCNANNNCTKEILSIPLDLRVVSNNNNHSKLQIGDIYDGTLGLLCGEVQTKNVASDAGTGNAYCEEGEVWRPITEIRAAVGEVTGRCCRFEQ
ncbi:MAG: hypothetical protein OXB88_10125 [Bacteriovoracales bacterium]|nr:hypothetical protein [Bacteriovoracales bacterium]